MQGKLNTASFAAALMLLLSGFAPAEVLAGAGPDLGIRKASLDRISSSGTAATTFRPLHRFAGGRDGDMPRGGLAADAQGNLYGTTYYGGAHTYGGTVFMLKPPTPRQPSWTYRVIYRFKLDSSDGNAPSGALTVRDGIIYGTTYSGANPKCGCGSVYRLRPLDAAKTQWKYAIIHRFNTRAGGANPGAGVVFGPGGALYGTTTRGGRFDSGTLFKLAGSGDRLWSHAILHHFRGNSETGPEAELLFNARGDTIYGTTFGGGRHRNGTIFQLKRGSAGWVHTVLHHFRPSYLDPADGSLPRGRLVFGKDGAIYGTTEAGDKGGSWNAGTIFRLAPLAGGKWGYGIIHEFIGGDADGWGPKSGLTRDADGNFYGTAAGGGRLGAGVVYKLSRSSTGRWTVRVVHSFNHSTGGDAPWSQPVLRGGALYGTTLSGGNMSCGSGGCGLVYQLRP